MEWMTNFHFLRPEWLILQVLALVLIIKGRSVMNESRHWSRLISKPMQPHILLPVKGTAKLSLRQWSGIVLGIASLALAGPTWEREIPDGFEQEGVVFVVIDSRVSMDIDDIKPSRLQHSKHKLAMLAQQQPNLQFSIFAYADTAHQVTPPSDDWVFHDLYLQGLSSIVMPVVRNTPMTGLESALKQVDTALEDSVIPGSVLLITSHLTDRETEVVRQFHNSKNIQVWAVGTAEGGVADTAAVRRAGQLVETRLSVDNFRNLQRRGVPTVLMETGNDDLHEITSRLAHNLKQSLSDHPELLWADYGRYLTLLLVPVLLFWFRNGVRLLSLMFILAMAAPEAEASWDWFFTPDQQGQIAMNRGNYGKAASLYSTPYLKGVAYYQNGDWLHALTWFDQVDTDEARHYMALSYAQLKYWDEAFELLEALFESHPEDELITANYHSVAEVMAVLEKQRRQRLDDLDMKMDRDEADGFVHSELAEQGIDATLDVSDNMVNPQSWLEGLEMTPEQLLRNRFQLEAAEGLRNE